MTAVLNRIRQLDAEYKRGGLNRDDFNRTREYLLASVEDARQEAPEQAVAEDPAAGMEFWHILLFLVAGAAALTTISAVILGDLALALTVTAVLLAAIAVRAAQKFQD